MPGPTHSGIRTTYKRGDRVPHEQMELLGKFSRNFQVTGAARFNFDGNKARLEVQGFPWGKMPFGFSLAGQVLTIKAGFLIRGRTAQEVAETAVTITGGTLAVPQIVYVRFEIADITTAEIPATPVTTRPTPNDSYWQTPLYSVYWDGAVVHFVTYHNFGDIHVPGLFDQ